MKTIRLYSGQVSIVDDEDFDRCAKERWCFNGLYAVRYLKSEGKTKAVLMHREILGFSSFDGRYVDHVNGDKLDNRRANLRVCTRAQNMQNRVKQANNTSGFKGVSWSKCAGKWRAAIRFRGIDKHLGIYQTAQEAHEVYCLAADLLHGEFANHGASK